MKTLTMNDLRKQVPAAFAYAPDERVSDRYSFIRTADMIEDIMSRGWLPVRAHQSTRVMRPETSKHVITFHRQAAELCVGDTVPEINLINAHDATYRWRFYAGLFRLACLNGLLIKSKDMPGQSQLDVIHLDGSTVNIEQAFKKALEEIEEGAKSVEEWSKIELDWGTRQQFAKDAIVIRNNGNAVWSSHYDPMDFLCVRREADKARDLWTVMNVLQENIIKGGVRGVTRNTKPITQVSEVARINTELWQLTEQYGKLHSRS